MRSLPVSPAEEAGQSEGGMERDADQSSGEEAAVHGAEK